MSSGKLSGGGGGDSQMKEAGGPLSWGWEATYIPSLNFKTCHIGEGSKSLGILYFASSLSQFQLILCHLWLFLSVFSQHFKAMSLVKKNCLIAG